MIAAARNAAIAQRITFWKKVDRIWISKSNDSASGRVNYQNPVVSPL